MNINRTLFLWTLLLPLGSQAQRSLSPSSYSFVQQQEAYVNLNKKGPVTILAGGTFTWNGFGKSAPLGFNFNFYYGEQDTIGVSSYDCALGLHLDSGKNVAVIFDVLGSGAYTFCDRGYHVGPDTPMSKVWCRTEGTAGNRIFQIEYYNIKTSSSTLNDSINFQVWLYEKDNSIEFRFGPGHIETPYADFFKNYYKGFDMELGFFGDTLEHFQDGFALGGSAKNPNFVFYNDAHPAFQHIDSLPAEGTVYRFYPMAVGIQEPGKKALLQVSPNPAVEELYLNQQVNSYEIMDVQGRVIDAKEEFHGNHIQVSGLLPGYYVLKVYSPQGFYLSKFCKGL